MVIMFWTGYRNFFLHCPLLLIVIAVKQRVFRCNILNWIQKIVLHCTVLLIVIAVQQNG